LKNITLDKIITVLRSKYFFAVLVVVFLALSIYIIWGNILVKGDTKSTYHTVVWIDSQKFNLMSSADDKDVVLTENNIMVYPEDKVSVELVLDPVTDGGAGQRIVIKRAPIYFVAVDGTIKEVRAWEPTIAEIIAKSAITLGPKDQLSHDLASRPTPGATVIVTRINEADIDVFEDVPFSTVEKGDTSVVFGQEKVLQSGVTGKIKKTYRVTYKNGVEVSRRLIGKETVTTKIDKVVASGIIVGKSFYADYSGLVTAFYKPGYKGKYLLVINLANGKQVRVKVIDFGPTTGPILDLGIDAFLLIGGSTSEGHLDRVSVQLVD
jgi:hypothetical protein